MHEIDLKRYKIRTDLIIDDLDKKLIGNDLDYNIYKEDKCYLEEVKVSNNNTNLKKGLYEIISFKDITDKDNFKIVLDLFIKGLKRIFKYLNINDNMSCLVVGLGNSKSICDSLGPEVCDNLLVTRHLFLLGEVEEGYRSVCELKPGVMGDTGFDAYDQIMGVCERIKPDFIITIDSLASRSIDRLGRCIQITTSGIVPGSGVLNNRFELSEESLNIPVISIGAPTVVDAVTIVSDTINYLEKNISYKKDNLSNEKLKLVPNNLQDYEEYDNNLTDDDKENILGIVGGLSNLELKKLFDEVLSPINYNLMVSPKEIDYLVVKLSLLISEGLNKVLHKSFKSTNN